MQSVKLTKLVEKMELENLTPEVKIDEIQLSEADINRPALQLAGFYDYFSNGRLQIIGNVENAYLSQQGPVKALEIMKILFEHEIPGVVFCRSIPVAPEILEAAAEKNIPVFRTDKKTASITAELIRWLNEELAPSISIHGVLVDVYGEGVLIMGESGIGKSEAALELIKRGHRLVSDDVVEIRKISDDTLVGTAPDITRHFIELRGIGIIDVKTLFGVEHVKNTQTIDLVIMLEEWNREQEYDRLGLNDQYTEFLGNKIVCHKIPIRPGRNLAIIVESAAVNHRQKKMGYNAAREIYNRVTSNMIKKSE